MKALVIFYSFEGNTRLIANNIACAINADLLELEVDQPSGPKGFMKYLWGGRQVVMNKTPRLRPFTKNFELYDIFFVGTPVWAFSYAPALKTFFSSGFLVNKKVALFCCHAGHQGKTLQKMKQALSASTVAAEMDFVDPLTRNTALQEKKARAWAKEIAC